MQQVSYRLDETLLVQVLVCGAELYTSNTALMPVAYYEKKASVYQVLALPLQGPVACG